MGGVDLLFHSMTIVVLPFWLPMIFFPNRPWTGRLVASPWIILPPVLVYTGLVLANSAALLSIPAHASPAVVAGVLSQPWGGTLFWTHAAAFDLFVGRWIYLDSRDRGISALWVSPALVVAVLFGPIGFLMYACVRLTRRS